MASIQARNNDDASRRCGSIAGRRPRGEEIRVAGRCSRWGGDGVVAGSVESVRRRGRCSRRWSSSSAPAPRPRVLVPSWFTSSSLWRGAARRRPLPLLSRSKRR
jgi:hypothetical protein